MSKTFRKRFVIPGLLAGCVLAISGLPGQAQVVVLNHHNSSAAIDTGSSAGIFNWTVDGQNLLAQQWFWYRVGLNAEAPINTISAPTLVTPDSRTLYSSYFNGSYGVRVDYLLTGFSAGSGLADIAEVITITNATAAPLDFHFFQYSDFDLAGPQDDLVAISVNSNPLSPSFGLFNTATRVHPLVAVTETVLTPGANHGEVGFHGSTLAKLNDNGPDTLNDQAGPTLPGNVTWAFQWDFVIPAGGSVGIAKQKFAHVILIPEPSSFALVGLGAFALAVRRNRRGR